MERITIEPGKRSGKPCIRGLRITVEDILGYLASGMRTDEILSDFPELEEADIKAVLEFAQLNIDTKSIETQHIRTFFDSPTRREILSVNKIEKLGNIPRNTLSEFLRDKRDLPQHHLDNLVRILVLVGYKPVTKDYLIL